MPWFWLGLAAAIVVVDQWTKRLALEHLVRGEIELLPFLQLVLVFNPGAAFGFLASQPGWQRVFFVAVGVVVSAVLIWMLVRERNRHPTSSLALALVLGGAIGNVIDRVRFGHVVDFVYFSYGNWAYPAFNVADAAITVGAILLILEILGFIPTRRQGGPAE